jgi:hypothetical protein
MNGNTTLSPTAQKAFQRIRTLQLLTERTGFITKEEQFKILVSLDDADCLAVAEVLHNERKGVSNGNPR